MYEISTTLDWVHGLQPDDLEKFLAEKKDQRMRVLCLDLEPTGIPQQVCVCVCVVDLTIQHSGSALRRWCNKGPQPSLYRSPPLSHIKRVSNYHML